MPGMLTSHSGGTQSGNTITYTVGYAQTAEVNVASRAVNWQTVAPAGLVAAGLLGGAGNYQPFPCAPPSEA